MLPQHLEFPARTIAAMEISAELAAVDLATMLIVLWFAATRDDEHVDIPERTMREALFGPGRAPDARRDGERLDRLQHAILFFDESLPAIKNGVPAPVIEPGMRRVLVDGCQRWTVDHELRAAFRVREEDEVIRIPVDFLRHARCRYSGLLYMAAAAWAEGELEKKWIRRADETTLRLRVPIMEIKRVLGFEGHASDMARTALAPAVEEINRLTDYHLDAVLVRAPSRRGIGKVVAVDILMGLPVLVEPKPRKPKAKPAVEVLPDNVIRLPQPRRITRRPVPDEQIDF